MIQNPTSPRLHTLAKNVTLCVLAAGSALAIASCSAADAADGPDLTQFVDPMIGTDFTGNTYPGAQVPFGMVQLSPDNGLPGWDRISGYFYPDSTIAGFSHTHLSGTGAGDLYDISYMPVMRPALQAPEPLGIFSRFSHDDEKASAGYYSVRLTDYDIQVELTAGDRIGVQRYTFPAGEAAVILNLAKAMNWDRTVDTHIEILDSVTVAGYRFSDGWARNQKVWFVSRFSKPFRAVEFETSGITNENGEDGTARIATFEYKTTAGEQLTIVTALSPTSVEGAMANLEAEWNDGGFDAYLTAAKDKWNSELGKITADFSNAATPQEADDRKKVFYTALYHSMLAPTLYSDVNGDYPGPDGNIHRADGWTNYSTFSLWDTYRASHPLFTLIDPARAADMAVALHEFAQQNGRLPVWNMWGAETDMMIGYHSAPVIIDAILKGLTDNSIDPQKALDIAVKTARMADYRQLGDYMSLGYVPSGNHDWSMSKTMEYAYDDYTIAQLAKKLGKDDIYDEFMKRAASYANTFNPATGFFEPRDRQGNFPEGFVPEEYVEEICESNAWQYLFSVQHDIPGLMKLMGGKKHFEAKLDSLFSHVNPDIELPIFSTGMIGQYAHGNEPGHHVPYLYNYTDSPRKGADRIHEIMTRLYTAAPDGICGNDDTGQMSAWYVFSALGFYPVDPLSGRYELGIPLMKSATIHLDNGKTFTVDAPALSDSRRYIKSATLNGKPLGRSYITYPEIMAGGTLTLDMTD